MKKASRYALAALMFISALVIKADEYFEFMGQADESIKNGNWEEAELLLIKALGERPDNPANAMIYSNLGIVQFNLGKDSLALKSLARALEIAPGATAVLKNRSDIYIALGRINDAYSDLSLIISTDSTSKEPLYLHSMLSLNLDSLDNALADCKRLHSLYPGSIETNVAYASYYSATEKWNEAVPYYTAALEKTPSADLYAGRAVCYLMMDRLSDASADISSGLAIDPDNSELYLYRAYLNKMRFQTDDARADMRKALELARKNQAIENTLK